MSLVEEPLRLPLVGGRHSRLLYQKPFLRRKCSEIPYASRWSAINRDLDPAKQGLTMRRPSHGRSDKDGRKRWSQADFAVES